MTTEQEDKDLFISYAHDSDLSTYDQSIDRDIDRAHVNEAVKALHQQLTDTLTKKLGNKPNIFFDDKDIRDFDHWKTRCYHALTSSKFLIVLVTKTYLDSEACHWEWNHWAKLERERNVIGTSSRLMFIAIEQLNSDYRQKLDAVTKELGHSSVYPTQDWFQKNGNLPTNLIFYQEKLEPIANLIAERLKELQLKEQQTGNLGWPNFHFVQRPSLTKQLERHLCPDSKNPSHIHLSIPILSGPGGFGKTALAHYFCHYAEEYYPGGAWQLRAADDKDALTLLLNLTQEFDIHFTEEEKINPELQLKRLFKEREHKGKHLLLIDNLHYAELISSILEHLHPHRDWINILVTTRLPKDQLHQALRNKENLPNYTLHEIKVRRLQPDESLELFRSYQPENQFQVSKKIFKNIAKEFDHHALSIESSAILLGQSDPRITTNPKHIITPKKHLKRIRKDLKKVGNVKGASHVRHLSFIFAATKKRLSKQSITILQFAAILPPDQIVLPWLRELATHYHPELAEQENEIIHISRNNPKDLKDLTQAAFETQSPWLKAITELLNSRLLNPTADKRITTIHRLHQAVLQHDYPKKCSFRFPPIFLNSKIQPLNNTEQNQKILEEDNINMARSLSLSSKIQQAVFYKIKERDERLCDQHQWQESLWELAPLNALARIWKEYQHPYTSWLLNQIGQHWYTVNDWTKAESSMQQCLKIDEAKYGKSHPHVARALNNLAGLYIDLSRFKDAEKLSRRALAINEATFGLSHPDIAIDLNTLAIILEETNRMSEAEKYYRRALAIEETHNGKSHPRVSISLNNLALFLVNSDKLVEAEKYLRRATAIDERFLSLTHPELATKYSNLGLLLQETNRLIEAEDFFKKALRLKEASFGLDHPQVASALNNLAGLHLANNQIDVAEQFYKRALKITEKSYGRNHHKVAIELNNLAVLLEDTSRFNEAERAYRRALKIDEDCYGTNHPVVAGDLNNLAGLLEEDERFEESEKMYRRAIKICEYSRSEDHTQIATYLNNLSGLLRDTNRLEEAEECLRKSLSIIESKRGIEHPYVASILGNLAGLLHETNRVHNVEPLYRRALAIDEASFPPNHPQVAIALNNLSHFLLSKKQFEEAERLSRRHALILLSFTKQKGHEHPNMKLGVKNYFHLLEEISLPSAFIVKKRKSLGSEAGWELEEWKQFLSQEFNQD